MNTKIQKSMLAGVISTVVMTAVMMIAPLMGLPKMLPPKMLSVMMGMPITAGWMMHLVIGIIFAFGYTYLFNPLLKIRNTYLKGAIYGAALFIFAQIMMAIMGGIMPTPKMEGSTMLTIAGSLMGHIIFGMVVSKTVGNIYCADNSCGASQPDNSIPNDK